MKILGFTGFTQFVSYQVAKMAKPMKSHEYLAEIKLHARQCLAKCPHLSFSHGWKLYPIGFSGEDAQHFLRFLQHADLLCFGRAKVLHQRKHFLMAQGLPGSVLKVKWDQNRTF